MTSEVWSYFKKLSVQNEMLCKLCVNAPCKNCSKEVPCKLKGFLASNAKKHLKFFHHEEYSLVEQKDAKKSLPTAPKRQRLKETVEITVDDFFRKDKKPMTKAQ